MSYKDKLTLITAVLLASHPVPVNGSSEQYFTHRLHTIKKIAKQILREVEDDN